ncbi:class II fructose-bisphosphate aldolase [Micropruina sonneratiae]|uniref:class II fructose-bisphosphate aldolase n=1 Tax=Micropruina sonneratiae TaxID=2986940 RepID=UPI0022275850|nr:class II fructose-bisphosphate aldolase [Micropruina sp. KQZ13P-5]MCW3159345.1 class II fructose-bisphosphate aldolase [Micropruina sp. KQZ13P-5]
MPYVNTLDLVNAAKGRGYAVPAINIVDPLTIKAIVEAADSVGSPVILQTSVKTVKSAGAGILHYAAKDAAEAASVGVSLHLDHCPDREVITLALKHGWSSVLFDASDRDLDQARKETAEVCEEAHALGASVESEIENIIGVEDGVGSDKAKHSYTVDQLIEVALETGTDLMAPQLGTAHGMYSAQPVLLPQRAREITSACDIAVVLHGGTGLSNAEFDEFIDAGVTKINISTALKRAYMTSALEYLKQCEQTNTWEPTKLFEPMIAASKDLLVTFAGIFHSTGKDGAAKGGAQ